MNLKNIAENLVRYSLRENPDNVEVSDECWKDHCIAETVSILKELRNDTIKELEKEILERYKVSGKLPFWLESVLKEFRSLEDHDCKADIEDGCQDCDKKGD